MVELSEIERNTREKLKKVPVINDDYYRIIKAAFKACPYESMPLDRIADVGTTLLNMSGFSSIPEYYLLEEAMMDLEEVGVFRRNQRCDNVSWEVQV